MPSESPDAPAPPDKVTILLATKDGARFLAEQLQSFRDQSHRNWELLVSDDGSSDRTLDIVRAFAADISQRVTIGQGPRLGFALNFLSLAQSNEVQGDVFCFSDQDDIWLPDKLERALRWIKTVPAEVPALYCGRTELVDASDNSLGLSRLFRKPPSFRNALIQSIGGGNTMLFNRATREILCSLPPRNKIVSHDWLVYQVVTAVGGQIRYDDAPCLRYRQHAENLTGSNIGFDARMVRMKSFLHGRFKDWNEANLAALAPLRPRMTPENRRTYDLFAASRDGGVIHRLRLLRRSGVYRQGALENIGLFVGAILGRL